MADGFDDYDDIFACCSPICSDISWDYPKVQQVRAPLPAAHPAEPQDDEVNNNSEAQSALKVLSDAVEHHIQPDDVAAAATENTVAENKSSMEIVLKDPSPDESGKELMLIAEADAEIQNHAESGKEDFSWLPPLWVIEKKARMKGRSKGNVDRYYVSPDGHRCRSKTEVQFYCKHGHSNWRKEMKRARIEFKRGERRDLLEEPMLTLQ